ncbi:MAG: peptidase T [Clostridia bacterium]|nr:peptidase T [Clostridia bacterium]
MTAKERFLNYVRYDTTSDEHSTEYPSTPSQTVLLGKLKDELVSMGVNARIDDHGYVLATIPANVDGKPKICFIAHVDTSPAVSGKVDPQVVKYTGGDIILKTGEVLSLADNPDLAEYLGDEIITSDGTSLLGADDKAGVAEIMTAAEILTKDHSIKHGDVMIAFTPDEEIGRGVEYFDVMAFGADFGYTIDGGKLGEIEYENFNAASAKLTVNGKSIHPGSAKNKMKNAVDLFCEFHSLLPVAERPVSTEKYEGFYMADEACGSVESFRCKYIIRDHDMQKFEEKKKFFASAVGFMNEKYGAGTFVAEITDSYYNMAEIIKKNYHLVENAERAMRDLGITPRVIPIRGGTDGAMLSYKGLPCPNLSTGGFNFHGTAEYIPVSSLDRMTEVILGITGIYAEE